MKKGDIVYVKDAVGCHQLQRGSQHTIELVSRDRLTVKLKGWVGAPFNIHRFTTTPPPIVVKLYRW